MVPSKRTLIANSLYI